MKNFSKGITLIEIMVVVSLITVITGVFVSDFPKIKLELGLSRVLHTMVLDIKTAQALSGSGHQEILPNGSFTLPKGYGIYINANALGNKKYLLYADINGDARYTQDIDYIVKTIDISQQEPGIIIKEVHNANTYLSINFAPPNFDTNISDLLPGNDGVDIVLAIEGDTSIIRTIFVNKAGLIEAK